MPLFLDFSQIAIANVLVFHKDLKHMKPDEIKNLIRHSTINTIRSYKKRFGATYGNPILCCDGKNYWRKQAFPNYKVRRKSQRENSEFDWKVIFDTISELKADMVQYFPYKVIGVDVAEADDIIAVLTEWFQSNELYFTGLIEDPQPLLIVSGDHDFKQLLQYQNVRQWSPIIKKFIDRPKNLDFMIEHIVRGDPGDDVPNVLSPDDVFISGGRQKPLSKKRIDEFLQSGRNACKTDEERKNYDRNYQLVNFSCIPKEVKDQIIDRYTSSLILGDKMSIWNYLTKHKCRLLLDDINDF